jgi:cytochrome c peroxidase
MSSMPHHATLTRRPAVRSYAGTLKALGLFVLPLVLILVIMGCGSPDKLPVSNTPPSANQTPQATAVPTLPATVLPPLAADAGGPSAGFNVVLSPAMGAPVDPGAALVAEVPRPTGGTIIDPDAAIRLGKALFWDAQVGSDGQMACASCHFNAGADNRTTNTIHPGPNALFDVVGTPGAQFPFTTFDPALIDDVVGSSGVISLAFNGISADPADPVDICTPVVPGDPAQAAIASANERLVTGRNTPPAVGAVFFLDNFWDGRASQNFNGLDPLGDGPVVAGTSSLASQSVGPPLSEVEMSCAGRTWNGPNGIGGKMVTRTPLANQVVHPEDSVLGPLANLQGTGLDCGFPDRLCTYADLIAAAFGTNGLSGEEAVNFYIDNFSGIWGQAVQAYEATLVPNRTPYDLGLLTAAQVEGLDRMRNSGCMVCHIEPEFSDATVRVIDLNGGPGVPKLVNGLPGGDQGFHNIGAAVTADDPGRAGSPGGTYHESVFNEGAFKTPSLRNLALTAPYMHNGSIATIPQVIDFYNGASQVVANPGFNPAAGISLGGRRNEAADFMVNGLSDCRVRNELAPFDHPSLAIPDGPTLEAVGAGGNGAVCP